MKSDEQMGVLTHKYGLFLWLCSCLLNCAIFAFFYEFMHWFLLQPLCYLRTLTGTIFSVWCLPPRMVATTLYPASWFHLVCLWERNSGSPPLRYVCSRRATGRWCCDRDPREPGCGDDIDEQSDGAGDCCDDTLMKSVVTHTQRGWRRKDICTQIHYHSAIQYHVLSGMYVSLSEMEVQTIW